MSGIDVLAVMDQAAYDLHDYRSGVQQPMDEARAAVAELIEAVGDVYGGVRETPCGDNCHSCRIQAALANCGWTP